MIPKKTLILISLTLISLVIAACFYFRFYQTEFITLHTSPFKHLPGWNSANFKKSLQTFQISCRTFLKQNPEQNAGSHTLPFKIKDWLPACNAAKAITNPDNAKAKQFFETWFTPIAFHQNRPITGLFTGYYMPLLKGSYAQSQEFNIPIYAVPSNLVTVDLGQFKSELKHKTIVGQLRGNQLVPYPTREKINQGAIKNRAQVLVWVKSPIDRLFLEIQGSGVIQMTDGKKIYVGYAGENGSPYTPVGKVLVEKGVMTPETASMQGIRAYLEAHPEEMDKIINRNASFVFFKVLKQTAALGAQGIELTPGYSLAIDRKWIPLGAPVWLNTTRPKGKHQDKHILQRLMIAQDTGGAIRGVVRGDVFWGAGKHATEIAGRMKNQGNYWLLLPSPVVNQLPSSFKL